jgi:hypothetical protein
MLINIIHVLWIGVALNKIEKSRPHIHAYQRNEPIRIIYDKMEGSQPIIYDHQWSESIRIAYLTYEIIFS